MEQTAEALEDAQIIIACGAAGIELASEKMLLGIDSLRVAVDLNAVPPAGLGGIGVTDKAKVIGSDDGQAVGYGAIGVGGLKMKIHKAGIKKLFTTNDLLLDADEIYDLGQELA